MRTSITLSGFPSGELSRAADALHAIGMGDASAGGIFERSEDPSSVLAAIRGINVGLDIDQGPTEANPDEGIC